MIDIDNYTEILRSDYRLVAIAKQVLYRSSDKRCEVNFGRKRGDRSSVRTYRGKIGELRAAVTSELAAAFESSELSTGKCAVSKGKGEAALEGGPQKFDWSF